MVNPTVRERAMLDGAQGAERFVATNNVAGKEHIFTLAAVQCVATYNV